MYLRSLFLSGEDGMGGKERGRERKGRTGEGLDKKGKWQCPKILKIHPALPC